MSLRPCPICSKEISFNSKSCPKCGEPHPFRNVTYEQLKSEVWKLHKQLGGDVTSEKEYLIQIEEALVKKKFFWAHSISSSKLNKSYNESDILLGHICDKLGMSHEFDIWKSKRKKQHRAIIIVCIVISLVGVVYKYYPSTWNGIFNFMEYFK